MRRVVPLLLVLVAAVPDAALAGQWYRCTFTGTTRDTCCCPEKSGDGETPRPELKRASCCQVLRNQPTAVAARTESRAELCNHAAQIHLMAAPADVDTIVRDPSPVAIDQRATAPPAAREPLYLRHAALLL